MTVALLINQSSFWVLAEESVDEVCYCDTRCSVDSVNGACPVCAEDYGKCGGAVTGADSGIGEEPEAPGAGEDTDTETVPDTDTDGETENLDVGTDIAADEETADSDTDESGNTDADTDAVSDVDADDEAENIVEEDAVSPASVRDTFTDNGITYKIISEDENDLQVEVTGHVDGTSVSGDLVIPSTASVGNKEYAVVRIGASAFYGCSNLTSVIISDGITSIGSSAFGLCYALTSVTILNDNIGIGLEKPDLTFWDCTSLNSFRIAVSENITGTPTLGPYCFEGCHKSNFSLTLLTEDGTTELSNTTTPTLAEAVEAYDAADGDNDDKWYDWKLPEVPDVTSYPVTINVNKDDSAWSDCGKSFALSANNGATFIADLKDVSNGKYTIYDITGASDSTGYVNTGVTVEVKDAAVQAEINYYSVTFYDDDTIFAGRIVPNNTKVSEPLPPPTKDGYTFYRWATSEDGSTEFDFNNPITAKTDVYASWIADAEELFTITAVVGPGGSVSPSGDVTVKSGADQQFTITPQEGYQISSVLMDGVEQLHTIRAIDHAKAGITDAANNVKYYDFENVTSDHTLAAYFEAINSGGDDPDNNGDGGSGGGDTGDNSGSDSSDGGNVGGNNAPDNFGGGDINDNSGSDSFGSTNADNGSSIPLVLSDTNVANNTDVISISNTAPATKDNEPKTGDASHTEIYATITMIAGLSYLLIYFADGKSGMTEEEKKEIVASLVNWAKKGSRIKKYTALAVIFLILVYYHSIGKRTTVDWKEVYEK